MGEVQPCAPQPAWPPSLRAPSLTLQSGTEQIGTASLLLPLLRPHQSDTRTVRAHTALTSADKVAAWEGALGLSTAAPAPSFTHTLGTTRATAAHQVQGLSWRLTEDPPRLKVNLTLILPSTCGSSLLRGRAQRAHSG